MKLETKNLILREWTRKDAKDLIEGLNNLNVSKWLALVPHPYSQKDADGWIDYCIELSKKGNKRDSYEFAIELKSEKKVIGGVTLNINSVHGTGSGGIWISEDYHGNGYGTEAFGERIRFAFDELGLRRLENGYFNGNNSSQKMQRRLGYEFEGVRRKGLRCIADGKTKDEYITGLLKEDWKRE